MKLWIVIHRLEAEYGNYYEVEGIYATELEAIKSVGDYERDNNKAIVPVGLGDIDAESLAEPVLEEKLKRFIKFLEDKR